MFSQFMTVIETEVTNLPIMSSIPDLITISLFFLVVIDLIYVSGSIKMQVWTVVKALIESSYGY